MKVVPGASRNAVVGWLGEVLKVAVTAPPERGKANAAVETTLAAALDIERSAVRVVAGHASPRKTVEISGVTTDLLRLHLGGS